MAGSVEDGQAACMGEIQRDSTPLSQAIEEHPTQLEDKKDQAIQQNCNEGGILTHVEPEQQIQPQDEFEYEEQSQGWSEYGEKPQPTDQPQQQSKPEEHWISSELCWYCIKSLPIEELNIPQLQLDSEALTSHHNGERLSYQQDPRPHFGVAHSSHSISFPLWGPEGPKEMKRKANDEDTDYVASCPHCHLGLPVDTLRWHVEKCLLFEGPRKDAYN